MLIIIWVQLCEVFKTNPLVSFKGNDLLTKHFDLRKGDKLILDSKQYINFFSQSINFSSNNLKITLPGLQPNPNNGLYLEEENLRSQKIIHHQIYMVALHENRRRISLFLCEETDNKLNFEPLDISLNLLFSENENFICNDIAVVDDYLFTLCYNSSTLKEKIIDRLYTYKLVMTNFSNRQINMEHSFAAHWMGNPKLRIFSPTKSERKTQGYVLLIFDQEDDPKIQLERGKQLLLLSVQPEDIGIFGEQDLQDKFYTETPPTLLKLDEFLFSNVPTSIKLLNVYIISEKIYEIVFVYKMLEENQKIPMLVSSCEIYQTQNVKDTLLEKCVRMIERPITFFAMEQNFYVYISLSNTMKQYLYFGTKYIGYEKSGFLDDTWEVTSVQVHDARAVLLLQINKNYLLFQNNFIDNSLTWTFYDASEQVQFSFFKQENIFKSSFYFLGIQEKGFQLTDITMNYKIEIWDTAIENLDPILIYLDDQVIMKLIVRVWDEKKIINSLQDKYIDVSVAEDGNYYMKTGFRGSNMLFHYSEDYEIFHYNKASFTIHFKNSDDFMHNNQDFLIVKPNNINHGYPLLLLPLQVVTTECFYYDFDAKLFCVPRSYIRVTNINLSNVVEVYQSGSLVIINQQSLEDFVIIDLASGKQIKLVFPESVSSNIIAKSCIYKGKYFYCIFQNNQPKMQYLRAFQLKGNKMIEVKGFSEKFKQLVLDFKKEQGLEIDSIEINTFKADEIQPSNLYVMFNFLLESKYLTKIVKFVQQVDPLPFDLRIETYYRELSDDPRVQNDMNMIVTNRQILLYKVYPKFQMFGYEDGSLYNFEYLDVRRVIEVQLFHPASLILILYESNQPLENPNYSQSSKDPQYEVYYALIQNNIDVTKQLIRHELIKQKYVKDLRSAIISIDEEKVLICFYKPIDFKILYSYVYHRYGPAILSKKTKPIVRIDDEQFKIKNKILLEAQREIFFYKDEGSIVLAKDKLEVENSYQPEQLILSEGDKNEDRDVRDDVIFVTLLDHITVFGNVRDFSILESTAQHEKLQLMKPLQLVQKKYLIGAEEGNEQVFHTSLCKAYSQFLVFQNSPSFLFNLMYNENTQKIVSIKFDLPENSKCIETFLTSQNFFCFYNDKFESYGIARSVKNLGQKQQKFRVKHWGQDIIVPEDNENYALIFHTDHMQKSVIIEKWDKQKPEPSLQQVLVGKRELRVVELNIYDFHVTVHPLRNRLTLFVLDRSLNRIIIDLKILDSLKSFTFLNNLIDLNQYGQDFRNITCTDLDNNNFKWTCKLFSGNKIVKLRIQNQQNAEGISSVSYATEVDMEYLSTFQLNVLDSGFNLLDVEIDKYLFIVDKNPRLRHRSVVMYVSQNKVNQAYHVLDLEDGLLLKDMNVIEEKNDFFLVLFLQNETQLFFRKYKIGEYQLEIQDAYSFENKTVDLRIDFQKTFFLLKLLVERFSASESIADDWVRQKQKIFMSLIIVAMIASMVLLFLIFISNQQRKLLKIQGYAQLIRDEALKSEYFESRLSSDER